MWHGRKRLRENSAKRKFLTPGSAARLTEVVPFPKMTLIESFRSLRGRALPPAVRMTGNQENLLHINKLVPVSFFGQ
jgi:hypothetical protein